MKSAPNIGISQLNQQNNIRMNGNNANNNSNFHNINHNNQSHMDLNKNINIHKNLNKTITTTTTSNSTNPIDENKSLFSPNRSAILGPGSGERFLAQFDIMFHPLEDLPPAESFMRSQ